MNQFDDVIIGFGKGGKTLAGALAQAGRKVALIERDAGMYGGTCINVACIPTKSLEHSARISAAAGGTFAEKSERYRLAVVEKRRLTSMLRQKNYDKAVSAGVTVITAAASFVDAHTVQASYADGSMDLLRAERFFLNTGSQPFLPPIEGLSSSQYVYTSETLLEREELPKRLAIIGGGYIGLEFSSYFANFGSEVTVIQDGESFIPREDGEIAQVVLNHLTTRGIQVLRSTAIQSIQDVEGQVILHLNTPDGAKSLAADAILVATGRRPNVQDLNLSAAGVELTERGAVRVDEHLHTSAPHIWAMGDVAGGLQFTYISLDDFRIVKSQLLGDGSRTTANRGAVPYTVFLDPPLSRVGMTEQEALQKGFSIQVARLSSSAVPKAHVLQQPAGMLKVIVDAKTQYILGAHFYCAESQEMINLIKLCMDAKLPYTVLRDGIFNHPTMSEALNDLFSTVKGVE